MRMIVPPECQGQMVEVSYGCDVDWVYRMTYDRSDRTTAWHRRKWRSDEDDSDRDLFDPANTEPMGPDSGNWEPCQEPSDE